MGLLCCMILLTLLFNFSVIGYINTLCVLLILCAVLHGMVTAVSYQIHTITITGSYNCGCDMSKNAILQM